MISEGEYVLLYYTQRKRWITIVKKGKKVHTHIGVINLDDIINKPYGIAIESSKGKRVYALKPTLYDFILKSERATQIVYPKDAGYIITRTGLQSGDIVVEIGTGSGALTAYLAAIVKPQGHVYTYDINEQFIQIARRNVAKIGLEQYITFNINKIPDVKADLVVIDLGDPWNVIDIVKKVLKVSKMLVAICPTMNQAERLSEVLKNGFIDIECVEIMIRNIEAREGMTRPSFRMIGHTAYLIFARRLYDEQHNSN